MFEKNIEFFQNFFGINAQNVEKKTVLIRKIGLIYGFKKPS